MLSTHILKEVDREGLQITETPWHARLAWVIRGELAASVHSSIKAAGLVAERDAYELLLDAGESQLSVSRASPPNEATLLSFLEDASGVDEVSVGLRITKAVENGLCSVYFLKKLAIYFRETELPDVLNTLAARFTGVLQFEVFESVRPFGTATIGFSPVGSLMPLVGSDGRDEKLETFRTNCHSSGLPAGMLPSDFALLQRSEVPTFNEFFDSATALLSLAFLANTSELRSPDLISYKMYGYRAVVCADFPARSLLPAVKTLHEIYAWAYEGGSAADKLGLVRNVVSIHLDEAGRPAFDEYVLNAIHSNYQIYLKGNIQSYLEVKNKLADLLVDSVERTGRLADDVLDSFKNNVFVVITFLLTVVVINGLKDTNMASIFSAAYVFLVGFLALCSVLWMVLVRKDAFSRYESSTEAIEGVLRTNYERFLMKAEIDASLLPTLSRNKRALNSRVQKYSCWWIAMLVIFLLFFVVGHGLFGATPAVDAGIAPPGKTVTLPDPGKPNTTLTGTPAPKGFTRERQKAADPSSHAGAPPERVPQPAPPAPKKKE